MSVVAQGLSLRTSEVMTERVEEEAPSAPLVAA